MGHVSTRVQPVVAYAVTFGVWLSTSVLFKAGMESLGAEAEGPLVAKSWQGCFFFLHHALLHWSFWGALSPLQSLVKGPGIRATPSTAS